MSDSPRRVAETVEKGVSLHVRVQPKASRNALKVEADGRLRVALTAPPVDGAANEALVAFMAKTLGVPKRSIRLTAGEKSREKALLVEGLDAATVRGKLGLPKEAGND